MKTIKSVLFAGVLLGTAFTSCDVATTTVMFEEDHTLTSASDTVYSVLGILNKLEMLADQTVLLGEVRGDLVNTYNAFHTGEDFSPLGKLANFEAGDDTTYNNYSKYYAVINNCNFYISRVDETQHSHQDYIFLREVAAVKAFRAWSYLQLAKIYGKVPFYSEPLLSFSDIESVANNLSNRKNMQELCSWLIDDLKPYLTAGLPYYSSFTYGENLTIDSKLFFFPVELVLGDLYLWRGSFTGNKTDFADAAQCYRDYLSIHEKKSTKLFSATYNTNEFSGINYSNWAKQFSQIANDDRIAVIPMALQASYGRTSNLSLLFNMSLVTSPLLDNLSDSTYYCYASNTFDFSLVRDSIYTFSWYKYAFTPGDIAYTTGDLRLNGSTYLAANTYNQKGGRRITTHYASNPHVTVYRAGTVYLRLAEAINRAGYPITAFNMLKYGLSTGNLIKNDQNGEYARLKASGYTFYEMGDNENIGMHAKGCGNAEMDSLHYSFPTPAASTLNDSINAVENLICNENAFEGAFQGDRFFDLMRWSISRNDPSFLASKIARRNHPLSTDSEIQATALYQKLMIKENWYMPMIDK